LHGHGCSGGAGFDTEFLEYVFQVLVHRVVTAIQDIAYVAIGLAVYHPVQHLSLAGRQLKCGRQSFDVGLPGFHYPGQYIRMAS
jgi:hypothetical protein